jgi:hypothetical protein
VPNFKSISEVAMRFVRYGIIACCAILLLTTIPSSPRSVVAQDAPTCSIINPADFSAAKEACSKSTLSNACLASGTASAKNSDQSAEFAKQGDSIDLSTTTSISTISDAATGNSGVVVLKLRGGQPDTADPVTAVLFGSAELTSKVNNAVANMTTVGVTTNGSTPVLLRGGAGQAYPSVLSLAAGKTAVADGRTENGSWLRVRTEDGVGWAMASLLTVTGDANSLTVLEEQNTQADFLYQTPMQAFTLSTGIPAGECASLPSGLLLQAKVAKDQKPARFLINGADVQIQEGTVLVRATPKDRLEFIVISGGVNIAALGGTMEVLAGEWTRVRLGGADGLTVSVQPPTPTDYTFASLDGTPLDLLAESVACVVGVPANGQKVTVRVGPGEERGSLFFMKPEQNFKVVGKANDAAGLAWWRIDAEGRKEAWVAQSSVHSVGACADVPEAAAPPVIVAAPPVDQGTGNQGGATTEPQAQGFAPVARTIWNAEPGPINSSGACTGVPVAYCAQLVALTPQGNGFLWKGQELKPYYMARVRENVYAYAGPNILGDARIQLTLVFTSPTTFKATQNMIMNNQKGCTNSFTFAGAFVR